jgi:NADPH:quinone reductase-like Zn-dependent oxidoreductase
MAAIQLAKQAGATVLATASSDDKLQRAEGARARDDRAVTVGAAASG